MDEIFSIRSDEHVAHEQGVVGASTNDPDLDSVFLVPSCESIDNVYAVSRIKIIDGSFAVDPPDL